MMLFKKIYYYLKWYIPNHREEYPRLYKWTNRFFRWGIMVMIASFVLSHVPQLNEPQDYLKGVFWTGLMLAGGSWLVLAGHFMEGLIWDRYHTLVKIPRNLKVDKTKFYASPHKNHKRLPEAQEIPIAKIQLDYRLFGRAAIRETGDTPLRYYIDPGVVMQYAESMKLAGLLKPIKVRPMTDEEKRIDPAHDYVLLGGQYRIRAAMQLGWEKIKSYCLDLNHEDGVFESLADNRGRGFVPWVTQYEEDWERLRKLPMVSMKQYAQLNRRNERQLRLMLELVDLLTPKARKIINDALYLNESEYYELHGYALEEDDALPLAKLIGLCHDINLNRSLMEEAVKYIHQHQMEWDDIHELMEWIKSGYYPRDFYQEGAAAVPASWKGLDTQDPPWVTPVEPKELPPVQSIENQANPYPGVTTKTVNIPVDQILETPYNQQVIKEGGLKSYVQFIHHCLRLKGLGTSPKTNYEWGAKSVMGWWDLEHQDQFPLFEPGPKRLEEPLYVFYITQVGKTPLRWVAAAEVDDVLRGCHIDAEPFWVKDYTDCVQKGILDRLKNPQGVWSGGIIGRVGVTGVGTPEAKKTQEKRLDGTGLRLDGEQG
jgi:hypothetical protein